MLHTSVGTNIYYEITLTSIDQVTKMGIEPL